jgi:hypothetical protein
MSIKRPGECGFPPLPDDDVLVARINERLRLEFDGISAIVWPTDHLLKWPRDSSDPDEEQLEPLLRACNRLAGGRWCVSYNEFTHIFLFELGDTTQEGRLVDPLELQRAMVRPNPTAVIDIISKRMCLKFNGRTQHMNLKELGNALDEELQAEQSVNLYPMLDPVYWEPIQGGFGAAGWELRVHRDGNWLDLYIRVAL